MASHFKASRRAALLGGGALGLLGLAWAAWRSGEHRNSGAPVRAFPAPKALAWRDLRPASPVAEAAALRARIEARRRGELDDLSDLSAPPASESTGLSPDSAPGLGGYRSHASALASDWIDAGALDTSPAGDAPFSLGAGRKPEADELVGALHGRIVSLPGYAVPLDGDLSAVRSFLLAPYVGACIHVPPPPANQIVLVSSPVAHDFKEIFEAVLVIGEMRVEPVNAQIAEVGYQLRARSIQPFEPEG